MAGNFFSNKSAARRHFESVRRALPKGEIDRISQQAQRHLVNSEIFAEATCVALYAAQSFEVSTSHLFDLALEQGKHVVFPKVDGTTMAFFEVRAAASLVLGFRGLLEPAPSAPPFSLAQIGLFVVPTLAFTQDGVRLGRGGGFYDRILAATKAFKVGLSLEACRSDTLPVEAHDVRLDAIATEQMFQLSQSKR